MSRRIFTVVLSATAALLIHPAAADNWRSDTTEAEDRAKGLHAEFQSDTYSSKGSVFGCGLEFRVVWRDNEHIPNVLSGIGSIGLLAFPNGVKTSVFKVKVFSAGESKLPGPSKVDFAWAEQGGRNTRDFLAKHPDDDQDSYASLKKNSDIGGLFSIEAAEKGFHLGVHLVNNSIDSTAELPPAPKSVQTELSQCLQQLN